MIVQVMSTITNIGTWTKTTTITCLSDLLSAARYCFNVMCFNYRILNKQWYRRLAEGNYVGLHTVKRTVNGFWKVNCYNAETGEAESLDIEVSVASLNAGATDAPTPTPTDEAVDDEAADDGPAVTLKNKTRKRF